VPSPLFYQGRLYTVKNGGIVSCHDADTGRLIYRETLEGSGAYYASPICGKGRVYMVSWKGTARVLAAGDEYHVLATNEIKKRVTATPAAMGKTLFVRASKHLYAFK